MNLARQKLSNKSLTSLAKKEIYNLLQEQSFFFEYWAMKKQILDLLQPEIDKLKANPEKFDRTVLESLKLISEIIRK